MIAAPGVSAAGLEVGQQPGVLLGLLGDPVDRRPLAALDLAERRALRPLAGGLGVDRVAVRARRRVAEHLVEPGLDARREGALEPGRLLVGLRPAEPDDGRQQPLEQGVAAEDRVGRGPAGEVSTRSRPSVWLDEPVGDEPAEHLARGLGRDAEMAADLGGPDMGAVAGHHPQGEQVLLRGAGEVVRMAAAHRGHGTRRPA